MEKLQYALWKKESQEVDSFRDELLQQVAQPLCSITGVHGIRLCVADSAVAAASGRRMASRPSVPDALLSLWVDDAGAAAGWEPLIDGHVMRHNAYLVTEAEPLINQQAHPAALGERMYGMCQVVFMSHPEDLSTQQWFSVWKDSHTEIAIETQATFGYRQNVVVRLLGEDTPHYHAIVEENFPPEAMSDDHAFYATGGDAAVLKKRMEAMMESCSRFIDFERIDVIPMSEYVIKAL